MADEEESNSITDEIIHPLHLINEVKKWPAIYDKNCPERTNYKLKLKVWAEIASNIVNDWDSYSKIDKDTKVEEIAKKWRHLRDKFKRQVEIERKKRKGYPIKGKPYIYFGEMMFLLPHVQYRDKPDDEETLSLDLDDYFDGVQTNSNANRRQKGRQKPPPKKKKALTGQPPPQPCSSSTVYVEEIDEDKSFLLSLLPSFKRFSLEDKLTAKVEILLLIQKMTNASNVAAQSISQCSSTVPAPAPAPHEVPIYPPVKVELCRSYISETLSDSEGDEESD